jgi:DNA-binding transcriptional MerR regulator
MKYKIGDVARILGVSTDILRYYEKKGVVHPVKDKNNDYRYYETWDINFLLDCLWYKNFGFGIDEISHIVSDSTYDDIMDAMDEKEHEIVENLRHQKLLLRRIREQKKELTHAKSLLGKCDICRSPEIVRYLNRHNFIYDDDPAIAAVSQEWLKYMPFVHRCFEILKSDLPGNELGGENYSWGLSLDMQYVNEFGVRADPPAQHLPSRRCLHSVFTSTGKDEFSPKHLQYLVDYASENGLTIVGNAHGNLLCSVQEGETSEDLSGYFEVWVPIAE